MDINQKLGTRIRDIRISKNLSQSDAAALAKLPIEKHKQIENGNGPINLRILHSIASAFRINLYDITCVLDSEEKQIPDSKVSDMLDLFYANKHLYEKLKERKE